MGNMSYCRFRNTLPDLRDCYEALADADDEDMDEDEKRAKKHLIELCKDIVKEFGEEDDDEDEENED